MILVPSVVDLLADQILEIGQFLILLTIRFPLGDRLFEVF